MLRARPSASRCDRHIEPRLDTAVRPFRGSGGSSDGTTTITHRWETDDDLDGGTRTLADGWAWSDLGWDGPLSRYRPLLSFNEFGGMFDGKPADLYDAIAAILGVEPLRDAVKVIATARKADDQPLKAVKKALWSSPLRPDTVRMRPWGTVPRQGCWWSGSVRRSRGASSHARCGCVGGCSS